MQSNQRLRSIIQLAGYIKRLKEYRKQEFRAYSALSTSGTLASHHTKTTNKNTGQHRYQKKSTTRTSQAFFRSPSPEKYRMIYNDLDYKKIQLVRSRRLELPRVAPQRPQRCASTNSATTARTERPVGNPADAM
jgi:hypothetical protein